MKKVLILFFALLVACAGPAQESVEPADYVVISDMPVPGADVDEVIVVADDSVSPPSLSEPEAENVKEFTVRAVQFSYEPDVIEVNMGDKVVIHAFSDDVPHGLKIPQYGVNMQLVDKTPVTVEFVADTPGVFAFTCSIPCGQGHRGMAGKLIVNE